MKRQLDRLKGKRLVTGDPNLMTKDEICINATPNGVEVKEIGTDGSIKDIASGGSGSSSNDIVYYKMINPEGYNPNYANFEDTILVLSNSFTLGVYSYEFDMGGYILNYNTPLREKIRTTRYIYGITFTPSKQNLSGQIIEFDSFEHLFEAAGDNEEMLMVKELFYEHLKLSTKEEVEASMPIID